MRLPLEIKAGFFKRVSKFRCKQQSLPANFGLFNFSKNFFFILIPAFLSAEVSISFFPHLPRGLKPFEKFRAAKVILFSFP